VRVEDPLRVAGGAARVAEAGGGALVELRVVERLVAVGEQLVVTDRVRKLAGVAVANDDEVLDAVELSRQRRNNLDQRVVDEHDTVLRVVDDVDDLLREEADVHGVQDRTHRRNCEVGLEVLLVVPHEGADAIALADAELRQRRRQPVRPLRDLGIARVPHVAFTLQRHDLAVGTEAPHPFQHVPDGQRVVVLHQAFKDQWTPPRFQASA
jgi:hypothetical protein